MTRTTDETDKGREADRHFLAAAYAEAAKSPDPSNQNGAVLVLGGSFRGGEILARDCNRFPTAFKKPDHDESFLSDRDKKIRYIEHAERAVIYQAARLGAVTLGATLYCPWAPCMECARAISMAGVERLVVHRSRMEHTPDRWKAAVDEALAYLADCKITVSWHEGPVGGPLTRVNGELLRL
jgi:dCMP deaminase